MLGLFKNSNPLIRVLELVSTSNPRNNLLLLVTFLSFTVAGFDYLVRTYTLGWTEAKISQLIVFFSPLIYFALLTMVLYKLRAIARGLSAYKRIIAAFLIISCSILILTQVFLRNQTVGSASYSIVSPLFFSGTIISISTFLLFFRKPRRNFPSVLICMVAVLWVVMPIGIDALYLTQGGYRGPAPFQIPVVSTSYDLIQYFAAFGLFLAIVTAPTAALMAIYRVVKSKGIERIFSISAGLSIFALSVQFINWGRFVWD